MPDAKPQRERGLAEVGRSGTDGLGDFFRQKSAATAAMHLGYGDSSPGHRCFQPGNCFCRSWSLWGLCDSVLMLLIFNPHLHRSAPSCRRGRKGEFCDLYFGKARICNMRKWTKGKEVSSLATVKKNPLQLWINVVLEFIFHTFIFKC